MIIKHLFDGGIFFMSIIYILWIVTIIFIVRSVWLSKQKSNSDKPKKASEYILFFGSLAFLIGLLAQVVGFFGAFDAIQAAGDVSPSMIAGGLRISFLAPLYGFVLFIISIIAWFTIRKTLVQ